MHCDPYVVTVYSFVAHSRPALYIPADFPAGLVARQKQNCSPLPELKCLDISIHRLSVVNEWQDFHLPMCQPRLAVTWFNVPAKCHCGSLWKRRTVENQPRKDYLINRIILPSILSQLCDNVKREQENNQSIFVIKVCHPLLFLFGAI